ncbi:MAG TPA: glycosyltransferase [Candidatus Microsaccharimonas sp.]|jgi:glycosyltransferase involved in cell wall biosynthesis
MIEKKLRIAVIAPPWIALPVKGYGGIELVLQGLVSSLQVADNVEVELFANGHRKLPGIITHSLFKEEQFEHLHEPYFESYAIVQAHLEFAYNYIKEAGNFDIIHDHVPHVGPSFWARVSTHNPDLPPILHTFHGPPFIAAETKTIGSVYNTTDLQQIRDFGSLYFSCISETMAVSVPENIKPRLMHSIHNGVMLKDFPFVTKKKDYFVTLARFAPYKGQHIAAQAAARLKKRLRMAGTIANIGTNRKLLWELSNPISRYRNDPQFMYYAEKILPYVLLHPRITYSGSLSGKQKMKFLSEAKALLFPITWEEPFGMSVIEALACGTPVIAMNHGAMPEIIQHGVNGFLAKSDEEFETYMQRIDEIDPMDCRQSVVDHFSDSAMTRKYIACYRDIIAREASR